MIESLHHIGVAVEHVDDAAERYRAMGFRVSDSEVVETEGVRLVFVSSGDTRLELLEPTKPDGAIAKFLAKRGEGMHHVAFRTPDIRKEVADLRARGFEVLDPEPRRGHGGRLVAFIHPRSLHGVLFELVQE
jgi:methylmalonyl-CoA/ethylmalonyl-CoA epimerase